MTVADEKDKLAPQLEEARWRNRQLEKDVQQLQEASTATERVTEFLSTFDYTHVASAVGMHVKSSGHSGVPCLIRFCV